MKVDQQELQERVYGVTVRNKRIRELYADYSVTPKEILELYGITKQRVERIRELYAGKPLTLKEIGELYAITKQRVEQIVQNGRDKCQRRPPASSS